LPHTSRQLVRLQQLGAAEAHSLEEGRDLRGDLVLAQGRVLTQRIRDVLADRQGVEERDCWKM